MAALQPAFIVAEAKQDELGRWRYRLKHKQGLIPDRWVNEDDPYQLVAEPTRQPESQELSLYLEARLQTSPRGTAGDLLSNQPASQVAACVGMGEQQKSAGGIRVVWSAGAADCIIVGAYSSQRAYLTHVDRTAPSPAAVSKAIRDLGPAAKVFLASQVFSKGGEAASSGLVQSLVTRLKDDRIDITAIYPSTRLAINADTGTVLADFNQQQLLEGDTFQDIGRYVRKSQKAARHFSES
ncbi:hypothetical protein [Nocardia brasiliensis]|uniref:hypothetical protein n=1 Tax=Nocardia brasiliensis TaxID=37326 RepID=UPI0024569AC6|nr:hypothetical protein [Nocardia brasiliensis]